MKLLIEFIFASCLIASISAAAVPNRLFERDVASDYAEPVASEIDELGPAASEIDAQGPELVRERRLTCDLFSFQSQWVSPNHSACAAKCIAQGKRGGSCSNGVCNCRGRWWGK
ncbi:GSCOCT00006653001.2-RA-CDS [Cotesia congregata]|uniref:Defensin1 n=1 Tax=Cotesia congregata TaxID=51543 RepID=A0A8J2MXX9_COTCN|nr:GSCOCT00006653001.2-RA-CDS [Cotesia congregata]CAG5106102.1 Defensin1 [Cotesia congregata]